jgi:ribosomal protein S18 acetylase RimI-like enzyme
MPPDLLLPAGCQARPVTADDVPGLVALVADTRRRTRGSDAVDPEMLRGEAIGIGSWTRRQLVVVDGDRVFGWASAHDRAAGRIDFTVYVDRGRDDAAGIALPLLDWLEGQARAVAAFRDVAASRLEVLVDEGDADLQAWVAAHGHRLARTWLNMSRPVDPAETFPPPRAGVEIRRVGVHDLGDGTTMPVAEDLRCVHRMLEESFVDHFNSYRESFPEFVQRLREDPGHRWDHWWLAFVDGRPGGAVVSTVTPPDATGRRGSYVDYIGVHRDARGRGVAKALLNVVITDAAERDRNRVGLEVDADSPTGADGLYRSMGWATAYVTQSWQKDLGEAVDRGPADLAASTGPQ